MKLLRNVTKPRVLVALMLAAVVLSLLRGLAADPLRRIAGYALAPVGDAGMYLSTSLKSQLRQIGGGGLTPEQADELRERIAALERQLISVESRNVRLHHFLETSRIISDMYAPTTSVLADRLIPARVVAGDALPYGQTRLGNAGRLAGVEPGSWVTTRLVLTDRAKALQKDLAAITPQALVGRTTEETGAFTARIRLVTDRAFGMGATIKRKVDGRTIITDQDGSAVEARLTEDNNARIPVWVEGDGAGGMVVSEVTAYHNVQPGDWLMTTGDDHMLPIAIPIGRVEKVEPNPDDPQVVTLRVRASAELTALRDVYIIAPPPGRMGAP